MIFRPVHLLMIATAALVASACTAGATESPPTTLASPTSTSVTTTLPRSTTTSTPPLANTALTGYFIGNSLTWNTLGGKPNDFVSFNVLARQAEFKFEPLGYHILCGSSLVNIARNASETCIDPEPGVGPLSQAFPSSAWDIVSIQPYPGPDSTLLTDETMIRDVMDASDTTASFYILTGWPSISEFDASWTARVIDDDNTPTQDARQYFDILAQRLSSARDVTIIPVGEVLFRLGKRISDGDIPGTMDLSDLYQDEIHLTEMGQWAAGVTTAAVVLGVEPDVFGKPSNPWYGDPSVYSSEYVAVVREVVAEVLNEE